MTPSFVKHQVMREATHRATAAQLFALIRNVNDYASWQKAVSTVDETHPFGGRWTYEVQAAHGELAVAAQTPPYHS